MHTWSADKHIVQSSGNGPQYNKMLNCQLCNSDWGHMCCVDFNKKYLQKNYRNKKKLIQQYSISQITHPLLERGIILHTFTHPIPQ